MSLWIRALAYMMVVGGGWLVVLPSIIVRCETGRWVPSVRAIPFLSVGIVLLIAGTSLAIWAGYFLIQIGQGTPLPLDPPKHLVVSGPYRFVRNPQAISMVLMVVSEIVMFQSGWIWIMLPLTILYLELIVGAIETRQMSRDFGDEYRNYAARVRKWIPTTRHRY